MSSLQMDSPLEFRPLFFDRVWGGRKLESVFGKPLPPDRPIGESWEIVDREDAQSVVTGGPLEGKTLSDLWRNHRAEIFGATEGGDRFPLLIKILDASEVLSVQVHPPASIAASLKGEPKTEMWHLVDTTPDASIYAGLKAGATRADFSNALADGSVEKLLHKIPVKTGDTIFIPSGRVHAIGAGCVIVEVQQNSDTTYRVFDWNRVGLDGKPRDLHISESLQCIDFDDYEPALQQSRTGVLVDDPLFRVELLKAGDCSVPAGDWAIFFVKSGSVACGNGTYRKGTFFLVPATLGDRDLKSAGTEEAEVLRITIPKS
jgi:mannose-6-phosphate isomerase